MTLGEAVAGSTLRRFFAFMVAVIRTAQQTDLMRYELRLLENGWAVWDTEANTPASVGGRWQTAMDMEAADDLTDLLNGMDRKAKEKPAG